MEKIIYTKGADFEKVLARPAIDKAELSKIVSGIFDEIKSKGDDAVRNYTSRFDGVTISELQVSPSEIDASEKLLDKDLKDAIVMAKKNIETFHASQKCKITKIETVKGVECWSRAVGIEKVGLYIPGGSAPLFSTVLMLAVPAAIAKCKEIVLCTPPQKDGSINPAILYAAKVAGVTKVFKAGGVQAIAAMACGTQSIPKVYKIFGPGNQYVTAAKMFAFAEGIAIDMPAGPSEVMVVADKTAVPAFVASDLLSQAEHGADSQVVLVSVGDADVDAIQKEMEIQLAQLPRKEIAEKALSKSKIVMVSNDEEALEVANAYAPEHLIIAVSNLDYYADNVVNAGSVFLGNYSPESAGDYASGTNHTLPTNGFAKAYSGISLASFTKTIFFQKLEREGLQNLGKTIETMAENEHLFAHKNAVSLRLSYLKSNK